MSLSRLILILLVVAAGWWLITRSGLFSSKPGADSPAAPVDRARTAAAASSSRASESGAAQREADAPVPSGSVTENMTPDQVRALLGSPDETSSETIDSGATREKWTYRSVRKTVIFENGVVVRVE